MIQPSQHGPRRIADLPFIGNRQEKIAIVRPPRMAVRARTFAKEATKYVAAGCPNVDQAEYDRRKAICLSCTLKDGKPGWNPAMYAGIGGCRKCGCTGLKALWATAAKCEKWDAALTTDGGNVDNGALAHRLAICRSCFDSSGTRMFVQAEDLLTTDNSATVPGNVKESSCMKLPEPHGFRPERLDAKCVERKW